MTQHIDNDIPPFDHPAHEREWLAQERAMQRERLSVEPASDDARNRRYRLLARALREPLPEALPADFAQQLARQVAATPPRRAAADTSFESTLMLLLTITLVVGASVVVAMYGSTWLPSFTALLPTPKAPTIHWMLALSSCLGASWLFGQWQRHPQRKTD